MLAVVAALTGLAAAWTSWQAWVLLRLPYNEEGRHFDGLVVHHEGTGEVLAGVAVVLWALVSGCVVLAARCRKG
ncbi:hypothetical protein CAP38_03120 [Hydrogenophaga sp. IBVHS2]|nr:hypothetical protein CAP38_03120 [Hydrogenophaga sp. IBVHS2]